MLSAAFRNRACDTLHPYGIQRMGYAGRDSETESARPCNFGKALGHRRLFTSGLLYRFTDATAGEIFV